MRLAGTLSLLVTPVVILASSCSDETAVAPLPPAAAEASGPLDNAADPAAADVSMTLGCGAPFTPDATPATLASAFGRENVIPETIDGPEGQPLNVTAIYPDDPDRRIEVVFANEEERTGLVAVTVRDHASLWKMAGGVSYGDDIAAVEAANGGPFKVAGFGWDYGGFASDWMGGKLAGRDGCRYVTRFAPESVAIAPEIQGDDVTPLSSDPKVRAASPKVSLFGISWAK